MQKILAIARTDLRIFLSQRGNLLGIFLLPVVLTLILGYSFGGGDGGPVRLRVDVLDEDGSALSAQFLDALRTANPNLVLCPIDNAEDDFCALDGETLDRALGMDRADAELTAGFLVIPAGYAAGITEGQPRTIDYYSNDDPSFPGPVAQAVQSVLAEVNSAMVAARVGGSFLGALTDLLALPATAAADPLTQTIYSAANERLQARPAPVRFATTDGGSDSTISGIQAGFGQSVPGMGSMYVMFTVLGGTAVLLRERRQWTLQRLAVMPIARAELLGGKILAYFTLGMIQYLVIFAVGWAVGLDLGDDPLGLLAIMIAFVLCITALAFVLAIFMQNEEQAAGIARLLALTLAPLGGAWWPLQITPDFMQAIGRLSPIAWAMQGFHELLFYRGSLVGVLPEVGVLVAAAAVLFGIAVSQFRVE
jgi:ABC-2 type transport system permease protein